MGVIAALLKFLKTKMSLGPLAYSFDYALGRGPELLSLGLYLVLLVYMYWDSKRVKEGTAPRTD